MRQTAADIAQVAQPFSRVSGHAQMLALIAILEGTTLGLFTAQIFIGAAISLIPGNLIQLLINAQLLNGIITPILLTFVLILANRKRLLGSAANGPVYRAVATTFVVVVAIMAAAALTVTVLGWFGIG